MPLPSPEVTGDRISWLDGNVAPRADVTREYLAGGSSVFPLAGQIALSRASDDLARDLGVRVYETMLNDPTVSCGFYMLLLTALNGPLQLIRRVKAEPGEDVANDPGKAAAVADAEWAAAFCERALARPKRTIKSTLFDLGHAWAFGCKLAEIRLEWGDGEDADYLTLASLKVKPNSSWSFVVDPDQEVVAIRGTVVGPGMAGYGTPPPDTGGTATPQGVIPGMMPGGIVDLPPDKFVILSTMGRDNDPRGRSLLRLAYNGWNLKLNTWPKYYRYLDLHAVPITVGIAAPEAQPEPARDAKGKLIPGQTVTATEAMANALSRLATGSYAALRNGSDLKVVQASGNGEAFRAAIDTFKHEILEGILLSAQAIMEAKHSSKANNESSADIVGNVISFLRDETAAVIHRQLLHRLLTINRGREFADLYTPEVSLGKVEERDRSALLVAFARAGYKVSLSQFPAIDAELKIKIRDPEEMGRMAAAEEGDAVLADERPDSGPEEPAKSKEVKPGT